MRILQITEAASAGVGRHVIELTEGLLARGHEVHLVFSNARMDRSFAEGIHRLRASNRFRSVEMPMRRNLGPHDLIAAIRLRRYFETHGPFDAVHCHSSKAGFAGRIALIGKGARLSYTPHALFTMNPSVSRVTRRVAGWVERVLSNLCDRIILVSEEERSHARKIGLAARLLDVIHPGVPEQLIGMDRSQRRELRQAEGIGPDDICIGFVGRLVAQKSPALLLRAIHDLKNREQKHLRLVFVGEGPLLEPLKQLARALGIENCVSFLGYRDGRIAMQMFDILSLTSCYEGFPYIVLEAMAAGLPIVTTPVGGITAAIAPGANGIVVDANPASIAAGLQALIGDEDLRARMGRESLRRVRAFSLERMIDQIADVYARNAAHERHTGSDGRVRAPATVR